MKKQICWTLVVLMLFLITSGCSSKPSKAAEDKYPDIKIDSNLAVSSLTDGNWSLTNEWHVQRDSNGLETLVVAAAKDSYAYNNFFNIYDEWTVNVKSDIVRPEGSSDAIRVVLANEKLTALGILTIEVNGQKFRTKFDAMEYSQWKNVLNVEEWTDYSGAPLEITLNKAKDAAALEIGIKESGKELYKGSTDEINEETIKAFRKVGLATYSSVAEFYELGVRSSAKAVDAASAPKVNNLEKPEQIASNDWTFEGEGGYYSEIEGKPAIFFDSTGEAFAWNKVTKLGSQWTLQFDIDYGKQYGNTGCARLGFGNDQNDLMGMISLSFTNGAVLLEVQSLENNSWSTVLTSKNWKEISGPKATLVISKYSDMNRIQVKVLDNGKEIYSGVSDEITAEHLKNITTYSLVTYMTQLLYSNITYSGTSLGAQAPEVVEAPAAKIEELTVGKGMDTKNWGLDKKASTYFKENGKDAMVIDSKGEVFVYNNAVGLGTQWKLSTRIQFGKYYSDTPSARIALGDDANNLLGLMTFKYAPAEKSLLIEIQALDGTNWVNLLPGAKWNAIDTSSIIVEISKAAGDKKISVVIKNADGAVKQEFASEAIPEEVLKKINKLALATYASQIKYSDIVLNGNGKITAVPQEAPADDSKPEEQPETKPAENSGSITVPKSENTTDWSLEKGIVYGDKSLVIKGAGDLFSWYRAGKLGNDWSIKTQVQFDSLNGDETATARFPLGGAENDLIALFSLKTVESKQMLIEGQMLNGNSWTTIIKQQDWKDTGSSSVNVEISKVAGQNKLKFVLASAGGSEIANIVSDEIPADVMSRIVTFGLGSYSSQVKFSNIEVK